MWWNKPNLLSNETFRLIADTVELHIIITDIDGVIVYANETAQKMTGFSFVEMKGKTPSLWGKQMPQNFYRDLWRTIKEEKKTFHGEVTNKKKNGELYIALATIAPILHNGNLLGFVGIEEDVTKDKKTIAKLTKKNEELDALTTIMADRELRMKELKDQIKENSLKK